MLFCDLGWDFFRLTEEATSGNPWPPDAPTMRVITRAAFEVNDFFRIVEILHNRFLNSSTPKSI